MFPGSWLCMLVYGDATRTEDPRAVIEELRAGAASLGAPSSWIERHALLVDLFIRASELAQGLVDQEFDGTGRDHLSMRQSATAGALRALASAVLRSWREQWQASEADVAAAIDRLAEIDAPDPVSTKAAEGYAFYALYPEAYGAAAARRCGARTRWFLACAASASGSAPWWRPDRMLRGRTRCGRSASIPPRAGDRCGRAGRVARAPRRRLRDSRRGAGPFRILDGGGRERPGGARRRS